MIDLTLASKKTLLVTGASSGIGLASARLMKSRGWRVLATARKPEDLTRLERDEGFEPLHIELTDPAAIGACAREALGRTGGAIDALFNNAAFGQVGAMEDVTGDLLRRQLEVNVVGTHELTRLLIPAMRKRGAGRIVQCSSVLGFVSGPFRGAYSASKFALEGLTDALRMELAGTGIHVALIEPGPIRTKFLESALDNFVATIDIAGSPHRAAYEARLAKMRSGGATGYKLEPEAVAEKLRHALESPRPKRRYYVTAPTYVAAWAKRLVPGATLDWIARRM